EDVAVRLLVSREELTPYERAGIDALMPSSNEVTSAQIQTRGEFTPTDALYEKLVEIAAETGMNAKAPWYAKGTSILLFGGGLFLAGQEIVRYHREPVL